MAQIAHLVRIHASPSEVYGRVASPEGISGWFTEASSPDYREGGSLELSFGEERVAFDVTEMAAPKQIAWRCTTVENSWFDTVVRFEFIEDAGRTVVRFDHTGWTEIDDRFRDCSMSWAYFLESLKSFVEDGRGTPESVAPPCEGSSPDR